MIRTNVQLNPPSITSFDHVGSVVVVPTPTPNRTHFSSRPRPAHKYLCPPRNLAIAYFQKCSQFRFSWSPAYVGRPCVRWRTTLRSWMLGLWGEFVAEEG